MLWCALDHRATRVGYVLSPKLFEKYGTKMTAEEAVAEAQKAVAPFELEFERVDWHTVYAIQQHVADRFQDQERILIAGDAAHTHSSGLAQGMNTGVGDAVNLGWRLAGVLKGWYKPEVLSNYSDERRAVAQHLIDNDKIASALISGVKPPQYEGRTEDTVVLLDEFNASQANFTTGLGISYMPSLVNNVTGSYPPICVVPGHRAPDVVLNKPGFSKQRVRLHALTKNNSRFKIVVFAGEMPHTEESLKTLRSAVDEKGTRFDYVVDYVTVVAGFGPSFDEILPVLKFGAAFWDVDHSAHHQYNIATNLGAIVVLRPDGILGMVAPLFEFGRVVAYFGNLLV